jgi:hypothetical protein
MHHNQLGVFIQRIYENDTGKKCSVIKWFTRLEIGDVDLNIMRNEALGTKELVLGYR